MRLLTFRQRIFLIFFKVNPENTTNFPARANRVKHFHTLNCNTKSFTSTEYRTFQSLQQQFVLNRYFKQLIESKFSNCELIKVAETGTRSALCWNIRGLFSVYLDAGNELRGNFVFNVYLPRITLPIQ